MCVTHRDNRVVLARGKEEWVVDGGGQKEGKMGKKGDFASGDRCTLSCSDDVLLSCTLKSCVV